MIQAIFRVSYHLLIYVSSSLIIYYARILEISSTSLFLDVGALGILSIGSRSEVRNRVSNRASLRWVSKTGIWPERVATGSIIDLQ